MTEIIILLILSMLAGVTGFMPLCLLVLFDWIRLITIFILQIRDNKKLNEFNPAEPEPIEPELEYNYIDYDRLDKINELQFKVNQAELEIDFYEAEKEKIKVQCEQDNLSERELAKLDTKLFNIDIKLNKLYHIKEQAQTKIERL